MIAQELRIGNLVKICDKHPNIPYHNLHVEIIGIDSENFLKEKGLVGSATVKQLHFTSGIWIDYLQPIPLTEEWLLNFGFEKDDTGYEQNHQDYCEWYQKEFPIIGLLCQSTDKSYLFDENTDTLRIKYAHQLQNLYFALTGKELI